MQETAHWYSAFQFARRFGFSTKTIHRWIKKGKLEAVMVNGHPRIPRKEYCKRCAGHNGCRPCSRSIS